MSTMAPPNHRRLHCLLNCLFRRRSKKHQSSASLPFRGESTGHGWTPLTKGPVTREMFPSDDVIMMAGMSRGNGQDLPENSFRSTRKLRYILRDVQIGFLQFIAIIWAVMWRHYDDVIMTAIASQITSLTIVYLIVYSGTDKRKHQSSASLAFVRGIHRDRWIPRTKGQLRGKCFHLMTSSCWFVRGLHLPGA